MTIDYRWRQGDAVADAALERRIHERGLEKKWRMESFRRANLRRASRKGGESIAAACRLKKVPITLPSIPPRREP